jgi:hypothetical protein
LFEQFTSSLLSENFSVGDWGYDLYEQDSWFSKHVDILKTPIPDAYLIELKIAWGNGYSPNGILPRIRELGNSYLSRFGVSWLHPEFPDESDAHLFTAADISFLSTQGVHFIKNWLELHSSLDFLIGLSEYQGKFKSLVPSEVYKFLGFASTKHTKRYDDLAFLYAMKGDYKQAYKYLERYGISEQQGYEWTKRMADDLIVQRCNIVKPYTYQSDYKRCGGIFLEENPERYREDLFSRSTARYLSPNQSVYQLAKNASAD